MTKAQIAESLVDRGFLRSTAIEATDAVIGALASALASGEDIYLRGLATFKVRTTRPKKGRDINRGRSVAIPARKAVKLILSPKIKKQLNNGTQE